MTVYDRYDVPTLGIFRQRSADDLADYLFECLLGVAERVQIWAYAAVTGDERARLDAAEDGDFEHVVAAVFSRADVLVSLATEERGIVLTAIVERSLRQVPLVQAAIDALSAESEAAAHGMTVVTRARDRVGSGARDDLAGIR